MLHRQPFHGVGLPVRQGQLPGVPGADQVAQHAVHQPRQALPARGAHLLDGLVHRGVVGHAIHEQYLRRGDVQYVVDHRLGLGLHEPAQHGLDVQPVFHGEVEYAGGQAAVLRAEARGLQLPVQRLGGVGVGAHHVLQRLQSAALLGESNCRGAGFGGCLRAPW